MSQNTSQILTNSRGRKYILETTSFREHFYKIERYPNSCAICRKDLAEKCLECEALNAEQFYEVDQLLEPAFTVDELKPVFSCLSKDVIQYIIDFVPKKGILFNRCPLVVGECRHIYHNHCINRWRSKRDCCPLDNKKWLPDKMDSYVNFTLTPH